MSCELFVGNLNPEVRMRDLENCFGRYGKIVRCDLKKNFGFIQFEDRRDAEEAIRKENNRRLLGSEMTVEWAKGSVGDKVAFRGGPGGGMGFRKPRSPDRFGGGGRGPPRPPPRDRSPFGGGRARSPIHRGGGRDRSPIGRGNFSVSVRNGGFPQRDGDRFGGSGRRTFGGFESNRFDNNRSPRERFPARDRFGGDRFQNDRNHRPPIGDRGGNRGPPLSDRGNRGPPMNDRPSNRGPPIRSNSFGDRRGSTDRFNDRGFGERRSSFGGPRRF